MGTLGLTWSCSCGGSLGPLDHSPCSSGQPHFCSRKARRPLSLPQYKHPRQAVSPSPRGSSENNQNQRTQTTARPQPLETGYLLRLSTLHHLFLSPALPPGHHQEPRGSCSQRPGVGVGAEPSMAPLLPQRVGGRHRIQCAQGLCVGTEELGTDFENTES